MPQLPPGESCYHLLSIAGLRSPASAVQICPPGYHFRRLRRWSLVRDREVASQLVRKDYPWIPRSATLGDPNRGPHKTIDCETPHLTRISGGRLRTYNQTMSCGWQAANRQFIDFGQQSPRRSPGTTVQFMVAAICRQAPAKRDLLGG